MGLLVFRHADVTGADLFRVSLRQLDFLSTRCAFRGNPFRPDGPAVPFASAFDTLYLMDYVNY